MNEDIRNDVHLLMQHVYDNIPGAEDAEPDEEEAIIHVHHFPDALLFIREPGKSTPVVESTPKTAEVSPAPAYPAYITVGTFIVLVLSSILFQLYVLFHPPIATVTITPKSQQISLHGTLQLGRQLNPITLSQEQTVSTTGKGHQDARAATGTVTFYNGQLTSVTVPAGTILTGTDGVQIVTDQDVTIPPESQTIPPTLGQATVSAHAVTIGSRGNIQLGDINQSCCAVSMLVQNAAFHGGQDERDFQTVAQSDIAATAGALKPNLMQSMQGALQGELKNGEALQANSCSPTTTADHHPGKEATTVKVTVSETCSGIAYNAQELTNKVTQLLTTQATTKLGAGYSIRGNPQITVLATARQKTTVFLSFTARSTWIYALSSAEQEHIKKIIAGKTKEKAMQLLLSLPGIERVSLQLSGFGDDAGIPKRPEYIHLMVMYRLYQ